MKHLKRYNESLTTDEVEKLKDFCETSLAYLLDDGYNVSVSIRFEPRWDHNKVKYPGKNHVIVSLGKESFENTWTDYDLFDWNDVKDYFIPFLQMLVRRYELLPYIEKTKIASPPWEIPTSYVYFNTEGGFNYFPLEKVINDEVSNRRLWGINLQIIDKI